MWCVKPFFTLFNAIILTLTRPLSFFLPVPSSSFCHLSPLPSSFFCALLDMGVLQWSYALDRVICPGHGNTTYVVFEGVKMAADVYADGQKLGRMTDQFLRYMWVLPCGPTESVVSLRVDFTVSSPSTNSTGGRFMACTGGWDWAPFSNTYEGKDHTFSRGLWRTVYTVTLDHVSPAMTYFTAQTYYLGEYPTAPLQDGKHAGFKLVVSDNLHFG